MTQTIEAPRVRKTKSKRPKSEPRQARVVIRRVRPASVLRVSLSFYACFAAAFLFGIFILWQIMSALGVVDNVIRVLKEVSLVSPSFEVNSGWLLSRGLVLGVVFVVVMSLLNVVVTFLYNLIADVVGGIEVTLSDKP
jgi:site-specific recombinase